MDDPAQWLVRWDLGEQLGDLCRITDICLSHCNLNALGAQVVKPALAGGGRLAAPQQHQVASSLGGQPVGHCQADPA